MRELTSNAFPPLWRRGVYEAIYRRRDMRRFLARPVSDNVIRRILRAAHQAGPIGMMQPWNFIIIKELEIKHRVKEELLRANQEAGRGSEDEQQRLDQTLASEAIEQAPINLAMTCDGSRRRPNGPSRHAVLDPDLFVTCCALQNLWLAARAEGVGVGWVNILDPSAMASILGLPAGVVLVGYLCIGHVARFTDTPATAGGESRLSLESVLFYDRWGNRASGTHPDVRTSRTTRVPIRGPREP